MGLVRVSQRAYFMTVGLLDLNSGLGIGIEG